MGRKMGMILGLRWDWDCSIRGVEEEGRKNGMMVGMGTRRQGALGVFSARVRILIAFFHVDVCLVKSCL